MLNLYPYKSRRKYPFNQNEDRPANADKTWLVKTEAVGKSQWEESPYLLANEWISANLAQFIRLQVPPFVIVKKRSRKTAMFISYSYDGDTKPDDVEPELLYATHPYECTGIVVFDILIANCDRHGGNLKVDKPTKPTSYYLIDHERALFYIYSGEGIKRLKSRENRLGINDGYDSDPRDEWHCLIELLDDVELITKWVTRIETIPDWFIDDICEEMWKVSLTRHECEAVKSFLKKRRDGMERLILDHKDRFPLITNWPLVLR